MSPAWNLSAGAKARLGYVPQTVALYLSGLARTHKVSTLYRRLSGISQAHQAAGYVTPTTDAQPAGDG